MTASSAVRHGLRCKHHGIALSQYRTASTLRHPAHREQDQVAKDQPLDKPTTELAVLGGGITGLIATFALSTHLPNARITLFESSPRTGGWLQSSQHEVDGHPVIFEQGPRSLRPAKSGPALDALLHVSFQRFAALFPCCRYSPHCSCNCSTLQRTYCRRGKTMLQLSTAIFTIQIDSRGYQT